MSQIITTVYPNSRDTFGPMKCTILEEDDAGVTVKATHRGETATSFIPWHAISRIEHREVSA